jgi:hypothetical protein
MCAFRRAAWVFLQRCADETLVACRQRRARTDGIARLARTLLRGGMREHVEDEHVPATSSGPGMVSGRKVYLPRHQ